MPNSFHLIPSVTALLMPPLALSGCGAPEPALPSPPASAQPAEDAESSSPEPSTGTAFGCLPPTGQEEALPGFLFDITDDPYDGTTMLRMTNSGENDFSLSIGDVGLAALSAGPRAAASDLSQASSLDGTTLAIRAGETS